MAGTADTDQGPVPSQTGHRGRADPGNHARLCRALRRRHRPVARQARRVGAGCGLDRRRRPEREPADGRHAAVHHLHRPGGGRDAEIRLRGRQGDRSDDPLRGQRRTGGGAGLRPDGSGLRSRLVAPDALRGRTRPCLRACPQFPAARRRPRHRAGDGEHLFPAGAERQALPRFRRRAGAHHRRQREGAARGGGRFGRAQPHQDRRTARSRIHRRRDVARYRLHGLDAR